MSSVATPQVAYIASVEAGKALPQTGTYTFQVNNPNEWERRVQIKTKAPNTANNSSGPLIYVFRSTDGGASYDNIPLQSLGFARPTAAQDQSMSLSLLPGNYSIVAVMGGGVASTWTIQVLTQQAITSVLVA